MKVIGKPARSIRRADKASKQQGITRIPDSVNLARKQAAARVISVIPL